MWRLTASRTLPCRPSSLLSGSSEQISAVPILARGLKDGLEKPPDPPRDLPKADPASEGPKEGSSSPWIPVTLGGVVVGAGVGAYKLYYTDNEPAVSPELPAEAPQVVEPVLRPCELNNLENKAKDGGPLSMIDIASESVASKSLDRAKAKDIERMQMNSLKALQKKELKEKGALTSAEAAVAAATENIKELQVKKESVGGGSRLQKAAMDAVKPLVANVQPLSERELAERQKKESIKHEEKMAAKAAKDEEYMRRQQEKLEVQAALELEKQKKEEAEEEALAEAALNKIQKNKDFEKRAARMLSRVHEVANASMNANSVAIATCREHKAKLKEAMEVNLEEEALAAWPDVQKLNEVRVEQVEEAHRLQTIAELAIVEYLKFIDEAKADADTKDNCHLPTFKRQIQEIAFDVKTIYDKLKNQEQVSSVMKHYYNMLRKEQAAFMKELQAIVPEIRVGDKGLNVSEEELNALLAHAHARIFQLKKQLREQKTLENQRLEDALCEQKKLDMKEANVKIGQELDKQYEDLQLEKESQIMANNRKNETETRLKLAKQASEHHDHLQDMLALQQKKLMEQFHLALSERLIHERHIFIDYIAKSMAKVKGLEAALEDRADLEKTITVVQDLMTSSLCLMHAVSHDFDCNGEDYDRVRIDEALKRCFEAAEMSPFAQAVLHSIPNKAAEDGIYTMSSLEKRFTDFYNKSIAIASSSNNVFSQLMSRATSYFKTEPQPKFLEACMFDTTDGMSTDELMVQAKYFMDKKCLPEVVRCVVQLSGPARELSQGWLDEARLVLEVRQAAEVLMSYANSRGMGTIF